MKTISIKSMADFRCQTSLCSSDHINVQNAIRKDLAVPTPNFVRKWAKLVSIICQNFSFKIEKRHI